MGVAVVTGTGEKAEYVRNAMREGRSDGHTCHWPGCDRRVPPAAWGCREHWYKLPQHLRDKIWNAFRPGQEQSKTPNAAYVAAAREVQNWIDAQEPRQGSFL